MEKNITDKYPAKVDVAVLMLFFNRAEPLRRVFAQVKQARPSRLFLYQDGPRGERDMAGIEACREVVSDGNIDWQCDVRRHYCRDNQGCDPSEYLSQKWAFSMTDKCVVLEDDDVPSLTFFTFCKEMLDRYAEDERIEMIAGFNIDEKTADSAADYFFSRVFSIWGWASWSRVVDKWDDRYSILDDKDCLRHLKTLVREDRLPKRFVRSCFDHKASGVAYYESIFWLDMIFNDRLAIIPRVNMINNIGLKGGTHYAADLQTLPKAVRRIFLMRRHDLTFPLRHPRYVIENRDYQDRFYKVQGWCHPWVKIARSLEELWLNLRRGNISRIRRSVVNRLRIMTRS